MAELLPRDILALSRIFPVLNRVPAIDVAAGRAAEGDLVEVRLRASRALKELLARLADRWRVVVAIDDLQWGDVDSARLLLEILDPPDAPAMLVVLAARDVSAEQSPMLRALFGLEAPKLAPPIARRLHIEALSRAEAARLAERLLGDGAAEEVSSAIAREWGGNAFFVRELAHHERSRISTVHATSVRLEPLLRERIEALHADLRATLEMVAVGGQPLSQTVIAGVTATGDGSSHCARLRDAHLVRMAGTANDWSVECYHDRVREAAIAVMSPDRRAECHRRLASALERAGAADPEVLLEHYRQGGELEAARRYVLASATAALQALAFSRAARLYALALELVPAEKWAEGRLPRKLADALALDGRLREAAEAYGAAAEGAEGFEAIDLRRLSAQHFLTAGETRRGLEMLERVLGDVGLRYPKTPGAALGRLAWARLKLRVLGLRFDERLAADVPGLDLARADVCFSAAVGLAMTDLARSAAFSAQHLALALHTGEPTRIARGLAFEMGLAPGAGEEGLRWAIRTLPVAERLSDRHDDAYLRGLFFLAQGHVAYFSGQWKSAVDWLTRADTALRSTHGPEVHWALLSSNVLAAHAAAVGGDLRDVEGRLPAMLKEARQRGDVHGLSLFVYPGILVHLARDRVGVARELLRDTARERPGTTFDLRDFTALHGALLIDRYEGRPKAAWARLSEHWDAILRSKILVVNIVRATLLAERGTAALAMADEGDGADYVRIAKACAHQLSRHRLPHAEALAWLLRARIHRILGDRAAALAELTQASFRLEAAGLGAQALCARRAMGGLMGGTMGRVLAVEMDGALRDQGIEDPARFVELMVPGFQDGPADSQRTQRT